MEALQYDRSMRVQRPPVAVPMRSDRRRPVVGPAGVVVAASVLVALLVGFLVAVDVRLAIGGAIAVAYVVLASRDLPAALVALVPLFFFDAIPVLNLAAKGGSVVVLVGALVLVRPGASHGRRSVVYAAVGLTTAWLAASMAWAIDPSETLAAIGNWVVVVMLFVAVSVVVRDERTMRLASVAFVVGGVASVTIGIAGVAGAGSDADGRLEGAMGDPNVLAAGLVAAVPLCALVGVGERGRSRAARGAGMAVLLFGIAATGSRGALVSGVVVTVAALVLVRHGRARIAVACAAAVAVTVLVVAFAFAPAARDRLTTDDGGNGRTDLWRVAVAMAGDRPLAGVGFGNFRVESPAYARRVGPLTSVDLIANRPHEAHNVYLQLLAEAGLVGLLLYATACLTALRLPIAAARRFEAEGDGASADMAIALALAAVAMLASGLFLTNPVDRRMWFLFGLGTAAADLHRRRHLSSAVTR